MWTFNNPLRGKKIHACMYKHKFILNTQQIYNTLLQISCSQLILTKYFNFWQTLRSIVNLWLQILNKHGSKINIGWYFSFSWARWKRNNELICQNMLSKNFLFKQISFEHWKTISSISFVLFTIWWLHKQYIFKFSLLC